METQIRINLLDVRDYFNMRKNKQASYVKWKQVKSLIMPNSLTFWQMFWEFEDYDTRYEPSMTQLKQIMNEIDLICQN